MPPPAEQRAQACTFIRSGRRRFLCCSPRKHVDYTPATQALPGDRRSRPVTAGSLAQEMPAIAVIPGRSRLYRLSSYRPVTPEVAGSSPVAPVLGTPAHGALWFSAITEVS
jgi:hypothetical protein